VLFSKHYTVDEARALLPKVRQWLSELESCQEQVQGFNDRVAALLAKGHDAGDEPVNQSIKAHARCLQILRRFRAREIQVKDVQRGLVDFPALRKGREVFLCREKDEDDIEFWHDLEAGYAGRERL
jgi:hypothetical protein